MSPERLHLSHQSQTYETPGVQNECVTASSWDLELWCWLSSTNISAMKVTTHTLQFKSSNVCDKVGKLICKHDVTFSNILKWLLFDYPKFKSLDLKLPSFQRTTYCLILKLSCKFLCLNWGDDNLTAYYKIAKLLILTLVWNKVT